MTRLAAKKRKFPAFLGSFLLLGAFVVLPVRPATAQVCSGWGQPCGSPGISTILDQVVEKVTEQVKNQVMDQINQAIDGAVNQLLGDVLTGENDMEEDMKREKERLWEEVTKPAMQDFVRQLHTFDIENVRMRGAFRDSDQLQDTLEKQRQKQLHSHRRNRPSGDACVVGSAGGSLMHTWELSRAYNNAADRQFLDRSYNRQGTPWASGQDGEIVARWNNYVNTFCDPDQNQGHVPPGCAAGPEENLDINVEDLFFNHNTIDIRQTNLELARYTMVQNLIQPFIDNPVAPANMNSPETLKTWMLRRSKTARYQAAFTVMNDLAARRIPSEGANNSLQQVRSTELGMPNFKFSDYPSYNEVMRALTKERFWAEEYFARLEEEPENVARAKANLSALYLMQLRDYYEVLERVALLLAVQVAIDLDKQQISAVPREQQMTP